MPNLKAWKPWFRYPVLLLINAFPMVVGILQFRHGASWDLAVFPVLMLGVSYLNFRSSGIGGFCFLQIALALYTVLMGCVTTYLYTSRISNDGLSYAIGELVVYLDCAEVLIVMVIGVILKIIHYRKNKQTASSPEQER